ncbi:MAG: hypothetical protein U1A06_04470, partial [Hoeflea sp.]|nr:hypothetical protein [Hoeflea sp.]
FLWGRTPVGKSVLSLSIAVFGEAAMAMEWTIKIEGKNEFGEVCRKAVRIDKSLERLFDRDIGLSIEDGKTIMTALKSAVVAHEAETYSLFRRVCPDCHTFRPVKDYPSSRIRTVFGSVEVRNPRWDFASQWRSLPVWQSSRPTRCRRLPDQCPCWSDNALWPICPRTSAQCFALWKTAIPGWCRFPSQHGDHPGTGRHSLHFQVREKMGPRRAMRCLARSMFPRRPEWKAELGRAGRQRGQVHEFDGAADEVGIME